LKICGKLPPPRQNAYDSVVCPPKRPNYKLKSKQIDAYKRREFRKYCANEWPFTGKFVRKIPNFDSFGAIFPHLCPDRRDI